MFEITQSADIIVVATLTAFLSADLVTSTGSTIPASIIFIFLPVNTLIPKPSSALNLVPSIPPLFIIVVKGDFIEFNSMFSPICFGCMFSEAFNKATPPPGTIPSLRAALVAYIASSTLSRFSFN